MRNKSIITSKEEIFDIEKLTLEQELEVDEEDLLFTYSDMITLLMTFFVMILSISEVSQTKIEMLKEKMSETLLLSENQELTPFKKLEQNLDKIVKEFKAHDNIEVSKQDEGVYIELKDKVLYSSASAVIKPKATKILDELVNVVQDMNLENLLIEVSGYTDDLPIRSSKYPSNWELSSHRATNIVKYFIKKGVSARNLKAVGYADSRPKKIDADADLNMNQIRNNNRRIVIGIIRPML